MLIDKIPHGKIEPQPSKSVSHRALICAALSGGGVILNPADNEDTDATLRCLEALGARHVKEGANIRFTSGIKTPEPGTTLDCGESGSTLRFLIPIAALFDLPIRFIGRGRLMERPMDVYEECFGSMGASIGRDNGCITVSGRLKPGKYKIPGNVSSQFVTGLLFALPLLSGGSEIELTSPLESRAYVDLTLASLTAFGIKIENINYNKFLIDGSQSYKPCEYSVEADFSAAAFFLAAGALGCDVSCANLNLSSLQGDRRILDILRDCGAELQYSRDTGESKVSAHELNAVSVDVSQIPDLVPPLAVLMCFCQGRSVLYNASRLRLKESDRLAAVAQELNRLGGKVVEGPDYLAIDGVKSLKGGHCMAHNDHRIAMMAAVASIRSEGGVYIDDPDCVKKSYPNFWSDFMKTDRHGGVIV